MVKRDLWTRVCSLLCRLIAKAEKEKERLTLCTWKIICLPTFRVCFRFGTRLLVISYIVATMMTVIRYEIKMIKSTKNELLIFSCKSIQFFVSFLRIHKSLRCKRYQYLHLQNISPVCHYTHTHTHTHTHTYIYIYMRKISGKVDKPKYWQRI